MATVAPKQMTRPAETARRRMSFEEFLEWDGDGNPDVRAEWVNGEVVPMVSISVRHNDILAFLIMLLGIVSREKKLGRLLFDPYVMRPDPNGNGRSPDLMLVTHEHDERVSQLYLQGPADLVVEIVSPSSCKDDYILKTAEYRRARVPEYWIIDPLMEQCIFLLLGDDQEYKVPELTPEGRYQSPILGGLAINPMWFNQDPLPDVLGILREWGIIPAA